MRPSNALSGRVLRRDGMLSRQKGQQCDARTARSMHRRQNRCMHCDAEQRGRGRATAPPLFYCKAVCGKADAAGARARREGESPFGLTCITTWVCFRTSRQMGHRSSSSSLPSWIVTSRPSGCDKRRANRTGADASPKLVGRAQPTRSTSAGSPANRGARRHRRSRGCAPSAARRGGGRRRRQKRSHRGRSAAHQRPGLSLERHRREPREGFLVRGGLVSLVHAWSASRTCAGALGRSCRHLLALPAGAVAGVAKPSRGAGSAVASLGATAAHFGACFESQTSLAVCGREPTERSPCSGLQPRCKRDSIACNTGVRTILPPKAADGQG